MIFGYAPYAPDFNVIFASTKPHELDELNDLWGIPSWNQKAIREALVEEVDTSFVN
jgi:hypothetical protein